jgi:IclR family acetate operon transcriptional repressor
MTLADEGWIRPAPGTPTRWQPTAHILAVAHIALGSNDLRHRARGALEALRDESGESVLLTVPDIGRFVVIDVVESRQLLRTVPSIGLAVPVRGSATSRAILPYMSHEQQEELLGGKPDHALLEDFAATVARGYSVSRGDVIEGSTNVGAPILELDGRPVAAVVVSAPSERLTIADHARIGAMVADTARSLSRTTMRQALSSD